jgi:hypothetical protein
MQTVEQNELQKHTYQRLENESEEHYAVFSEYLHMGKHRRVRKLSPFHQLTLHKIYYLSKKYHWKERILHFENTIGRWAREEKRQDYRVILTEYEEYSLLTFSKMQGRYREFIGNISDFWPNEVEEKDLKEFIQKKNKEKRETGDFRHIMPLYNDQTADKNNISKQLNHIEKVLNIIGKFQIISDKFISKLDRGEFQKETKESEIFLYDLEELSDWIDENNQKNAQENNDKIIRNHREQKVVNR